MYSMTASAKPCRNSDSPVTTKPTGNTSQSSSGSTGSASRTTDSAINRLRTHTVTTIAVVGSSNDPSDVVQTCHSASSLNTPTMRLFGEKPCGMRSSAHSKEGSQAKLLT